MCIDLPCRVLSVDRSRQWATVETRRAPRRVSLVMLQLEGVAVEPGDWLMANAGIAVATIDAAEAQTLAQQFETMEEESS